MLVELDDSLIRDLVQTKATEQAKLSAIQWMRTVGPLIERMVDAVIEDSDKAELELKTGKPAEKKKLVN